MTYIFTKNKILTLNATVIPQNNITIKIYEWTINNLIIPENSDLVTINTNNLILGENIISLRVLNSCNLWSKYVTKIINVINETEPIPDEVINMEQISTITVDKPIINVDVTIMLKGTVIVTVKDPLGNVIPNATAVIDTVSEITNTSGIATLNEIDYGIKTLKVSL